MSNIVISAAQRLNMTEADLFRSVFAHRGHTAHTLWREAYAVWCERDALPRTCSEEWFFDTCNAIVAGKLVLHVIEEPCYSHQTVPLFDGTDSIEEDDGN